MPVPTRERTISPGIAELFVGAAAANTVMDGCGRRPSLSALLFQKRRRRSLLSVCKMMRSAPLPQLGCQFDAFLYAPLGDDGNGMVLSVLSALARSDVDPWHEAESLAGLPRASAIERLTSMIAALPVGQSGHKHPGTIAARLIALLPQPRKSAERPGETPPCARTVLDRHTLTRLIVINLLLLAGMLGTQWMEAGGQPRTQDVDDLAAASPADPAPTSRPNPGQ